MDEYVAVTMERLLPPPAQCPNLMDPSVRLSCRESSRWRSTGKPTFFFFGTKK